MFAATGSTITAAISSGCASNSALDRRQIVVRRVQRQRRHRLRHARRSRNPKCRQSRPRLRKKTVAMPVIAALELHDQIAPGRRARQPHRAHGRFRARADKPHALQRGQAAAESSSPAPLPAPWSSHSSCRAAPAPQSPPRPPDARAPESSRPTSKRNRATRSRRRPRDARLRRDPPPSASPPTAPNARTGLFTPPTRISRARSKISCERGRAVSLRVHCAASFGTHRSYAVRHRAVQHAFNHRAASLA